MGNQRLARSRLASVTPAPSPDPACLLPASIFIDDADTPTDIVDALILSAFADGRQPYARTAKLNEVRPGASLTPPGARTLRVATDTGREARLAAGDGWTLRAVQWRSGSAEVTVTAVTDELAGSVLDRIIARDAADRGRGSAEERRVTIGFWHYAQRCGAWRSPRTVSIEPWAQIRGNYASGTAQALDRLMAVTPDTLAGRLVLPEAAAWLGRPDAVASAMTLAELYAERNVRAPISSAEPPATVGLYL